MQKKSKKQDIELAALLFLVGLLLFIYPVVNQVSSYHTEGFAGDAFSLQNSEMHQNGGIVRRAKNAHNTVKILMSQGPSQD